MLARRMETTWITTRNNHRLRNGIYKQMMGVDNGKRIDWPSYDYSISLTSKWKSGAHKSRTKTIFAQIRQSPAG